MARTCISRVGRLSPRNKSRKFVFVFTGARWAFTVTAIPFLYASFADYILATWQGLFFAKLL